MRNYAKKRRIKRYILTTIFFAIIAYGLLIYFQKYGFYENKIAKIGDEKISEREIKNEILNSFNIDLSAQNVEISSLPQELIKKAAQEIYFNKKLIELAKKSKIDEKREVKDKIEKYRDFVIIQSYLDEIISQKLAPKNIKKRYLEFSSKLEGKREFLTYKIVIDSENRAKWIYRVFNETPAYLKSKKFSKLAKKYSLDNEAKANGGKYGYVLEDDFHSDEIKEISDFKKSGYTKPIKIDNSWVIIWIKNVRDAEIPSFEEIAEDIKNEIILDTTKNIYNEIMANKNVELLIQTKEKQQIEIKEDNIDKR